jgi:hypothetical protein
MIKYIVRFHRPAWNPAELLHPPPSYSYWLLTPGVRRQMWWETHIAHVQQQQQKKALKRHIRTLVHTPTPPLVWRHIARTPRD